MLIVDEAKECEQALEDELKLLKEALENERKKKAAESTNDKKDTSSESKDAPSANPSVELMLESDVTPPDNHWTVSSLLGRLRDDLTTPLPPNSNLGLVREMNESPYWKKRRMNAGVPTSIEDGSASGRSTPNLATGAGSDADRLQLEQLVQIQDHPYFKVEHKDSEKLVAVWKKMSLHRSTLVFRRPVNPKDAPGYSDRIHFPMDLSLIRKLIKSGIIRSYYDLALRVHLIAHNCVKYNGRESDYAVVTRRFESMCAELIIKATLSHEKDGGSGTLTITNSSLSTAGTTTSRSATPRDGEKPLSTALPQNNVRDNGAPDITDDSGMPPTRTAGDAENTLAATKEVGKESIKTENK